MKNEAEITVTCMTIGEAREIARIFGGGGGTGTSLVIGECYLIRTVTMAYTGRLVSITDTDLVLEDAAWIADTGRYHVALAEGALNEVEPYPGRVIVGRGGLIDAAPWSHPLPREAR